MGIYSEYLEKNLPFEDLAKERKKQLTRISELRGRDILVYAAASSKASLRAPVALDNTDLLPINDQLSNLSGKAVDVLLETGGGSGETAEDIVRTLYIKYSNVGFIVPGMAKSAGTIMVMAGDEILMEPGSSSLGPIDAQIQWEGKVFSAEAFLKGLERIKEEVTALNSLNRAYIPGSLLQSGSRSTNFKTGTLTEHIIPAHLSHRRRRRRERLKSRIIYAITANG